MLFDELTDEQRQAATSPVSVAVTAGAGTGKTKMLAARYLFHVREQQLSPLSVVAVTFTEKAADELRSRIRAALTSELADQDTLAEIEAAQISTVHSLASRVCRDFYYIADLPADFTILDDTGAPLWFSREFEEAIGTVPSETVMYLGYDWLKRALQELLSDPFSARTALSFGAEEWRSRIEAAGRAAIRDFLSSYECEDAMAAVEEFKGASDDRLEIARESAVWALNEIMVAGDIAAAFERLDKMQAHLGSKTAWPEGGKERVGPSLKALKTLARKTLPIATLVFNEHDEEAARRIGYLRDAFDKVDRHLREVKLRERVLDFNDLEQYALEILRHKDGEALHHYAKRWKAFLVDEFQDTSPIQAEILDLLTEGGILTIVGDEKQSIYGFRGAEPGVFSRFRAKVTTERAGTEVELSRSFRTHRDLIAEMNSVFAPVLGPIHQSLRSELCPPTETESPFIRFSFVSKPKEQVNIAEQRMIEAEHVAETIIELVKNGERIFDPRLGTHRPVTYGDIAVLSRTWDVLDTFAESFTAYRIPHINTGGGSLLTTRVALDAFALLSFLVEPRDDIHLVTVLRSPFFAISDVHLFELASKKNEQTSWWELIESSNGPAIAAYSMLRTLLDARTKEASQILALADRLTGYSAIAANLPEGERRLADWHGVISLVRQIERDGDRDLFSTVRQIQHLIANEVEMPRPQIEAGQAISLMTIHKSKGLEWPIVFVVDLGRRRSSPFRKLLIDRELGVSFRLDTDENEKAEPSIFRLSKVCQDERETDEARRLLYVAITRAKDRVFLSASSDKGPALDLLRPGLESAAIPAEEISRPNLRGPASGSPELDEKPDPPLVQTAPVKCGPNTLTPTGLDTYAICPKRFYYAFVECHPGLGEGYATSSLIGSLTHKALELNVSDEATLTKCAPACDPQLVADALLYADTFRTDPVFTGLDLNGALREQPFSFEWNGVLISGVADVVGKDFVLDYKTTAEAEPDKYRIQMWAYAAAFEKPRAFVAFLRQKELFELNESDLEEAAEIARDVVTGIRSSTYLATPSPKHCATCRYATICTESVAE